MSSQTSDFRSVYIIRTVVYGKRIFVTNYTLNIACFHVCCVSEILFFLSGVFNIHGILINILLDVETRLSLVITVDMPDPHNTMPNERILNVNSKIAAVFFMHNPNVLTF